MTETIETLPPRLAQIVEDFSWAEGRDKLELLLEYSEKMPPLPDWLNRQANMEQIHECMTPVFVHAELEDGGMHYYFDIPPESPTVRGYAAILGEGLRGVAPEDVLKVPAHFYLEMGLQKVLTTQRLNGIGAILAHVKRLATQELAK
ncbi:MAG: SufE family protein [Anaerolineaceae bacterium]|nr:SufE family protein [Anaerolineaceae bacterium]MCB9098112.1 SufE family protein [Anaerolineales bacterium]